VELLAVPQLPEDQPQAPQVPGALLRASDLGPAATAFDGDADDRVLVDRPENGGEQAPLALDTPAIIGERSPDPALHLARRRDGPPQAAHLALVALKLGSDGLSLPLLPLGEVSQILGRVVVQVL